MTCPLEKVGFNEAIVQGDHDHRYLSLKQHIKHVSHDTLVTLNHTKHLSSDTYLSNYDPHSHTGTCLDIWSTLDELGPDL